MEHTRFMRTDTVLFPMALTSCEALRPPSPSLLLTQTSETDSGMMEGAPSLALLLSCCVAS